MAGYSPLSLSFAIEIAMGGVAPSRLITVGANILNSYLLLVVIVLGFFGNLLNVFIFSRSNLRQNTCVIYLLLTSVLNIITIFFGAFFRTVSAYGIDITWRNPLFCKIRFYLTYISQSAGLWLLVFACIDRYISSSLKISRRRWVNRQITYWIIVGVLLVASISYTQILHCFDAPTTGSGVCNIRDQICTFVDTGSFLFFNSFLPPSLMLGFGGGMMMNIRHNRRRITAVFSCNVPKHNIKRRDIQMISALLLQVISTSICMFPIAGMKLYLSVTSDVPKTIDRLQLESFLYQVSVLLCYMNSSVMFFIYTLHGQVFRAELFRLGTHLCACLSRQNVPQLKRLCKVGVDPVERY